MTKAKIILPLIFAFYLTGCGSDSLDHKPPQGMGSLIVESFTSDDINVFINGQQKTSVPVDQHGIVDMTPGIYKVELREKHGQRNFTEQIEIIEQKVVVMKVIDGPRPFLYNVQISVR